MCFVHPLFLLSFFCLHSHLCFVVFSCFCLASNIHTINQMQRGPAYEMGDGEMLEESEEEKKCVRKKFVLV